MVMQGQFQVSVDLGRECPGAPLIAIVRPTHISLTACILLHLCLCVPPPATLLLIFPSSQCSPTSFTWLCCAVCAAGSMGGWESSQLADGQQGRWVCGGQWPWAPHQKIWALAASPPPGMLMPSLGCWHMEEDKGPSLQITVDWQVQKGINSFSDTLVSDRIWFLMIVLN